MTNQLPNDLSHLSDAEFHSLCPQGEHAPGPQPLSPAAQAVLTATTQHEYGLDPSDIPKEAVRIGYTVAAALRAAADQVVPPEQERLFNEERPWDGELCAVVEIRQQLLAIATELEETQ
jgi:hypothetical protein